LRQSNRSQSRLAAIAILALTGYIAKSEDEEWKMRARNDMIAARAAIDIAYGEGKASEYESWPYYGTGPYPDYTFNDFKKLNGWLFSSFGDMTDLSDFMDQF
jgi:hypothetical protein